MLRRLAPDLLLANPAPASAQIDGSLRDDRLPMAGAETERSGQPAVLETRATIHPAHVAADRFAGAYARARLF